MIFTGAGRAFTAGIDLTAAQSVFQNVHLRSLINLELSHLRSLFSPPSQTDGKLAKYDPVPQLDSCPFPVIGAINGFAITGGFELALACDFLVGTPDTKFMDTHAKFGLMPSWGLSQKLSRLIGPNRAREVSFTARVVSAEEAHKWGLLNHVVPADQLLPTAIKIAQEIAQNHQKLVVGYKSVLNDGFGKTLSEGRVLERERAFKYYASMSPSEFAAMQKFIAQRSQMRAKM